MSTLSISIIALIACVVGVVVVFNLWQARGNRRRDEHGQGAHSAAVTPRAGESGKRRPGPERSSAGGHRWQPGADQNAWARQRREPTLTADDEAAPAAGFAPDAFDTADHPPADPEQAFRMSADDDEPNRPPDNDDDLGPPQFEAPRFEPSRLAPLRPEEARTAVPRFEPAGEQGAPQASASRGVPSFENTRPFRPAPGTAAPVRPSAPVAVNATVPGAVPGTLAGGVGNSSSPIAGEAAGKVGGKAGSSSGMPAGVGSGANAATGVPAREVEPVFVPAAVDHVVTLIPRAPVNAERLIALTSSLRHVGSKSIRIEIDGGQGRWIPLQSGTMVGCLRCSVLLANRQGPLNAVELSDFSAALESLAGQIGARFAAPDMNQVLRQARELDGVAARLDTQVDLGVEAAEPITPARLAAIARKLDLFDRGGGRFACFAEDGELLYSLMAGETADMLAFVLDVPRTAQFHDPWRSMVACASSCAQVVGGRVVDGAGRGMSVGMIDSVGLQIDKRYRELADAGLKAGAPATLRVFN